MVEFYVASEERKDLSVVAAFHHTKNAALITKSIYIDATSYAPVIPWHWHCLRKYATSWYFRVDLSS